MAILPLVEVEAFLVDEEGFMLAPGLRGERVAQLLAADAGLGALTPEHWRVIDYVGGRYDQDRREPPTMRLCKPTASWGRP